MDHTTNNSPSESLFRRRESVPRVEPSSLMALSDHPPYLSAASSESSDSSMPDSQKESTQYLYLLRTYAVIDILSLVYRALLPLPLWMSYFSNGVGGNVFAFIYFFCKVIDLSAKTRALPEVIRNLLTGKLVGLDFPRYFDDY